MFLFRGAGRNPPPPRTVSAEYLLDRRGFLRGLALFVFSAPTAYASLPVPMPRPGDDDRDDMPLYAVEVVPTDGAEVPRPKDHAAELLLEDGGEAPCQLDGLPTLSVVL